MSGFEDQFLHCDCPCSHYRDKDGYLYLLGKNCTHGNYANKNPKVKSKVIVFTKIVLSCKGKVISLVNSSQRVSNENKESIERD